MRSLNLKFLSRLLCYLFIFFLPSCGYTTRSLLPEYIKGIYVKNFKNEIDLTQEISSKNVYRLYRPGLEIELTNAIIDRFVFDGNLKVEKDEQLADAVLQGEIVDYVKEPLRYDDSNQEVIEFRVRVAVSVTLFDVRQRKRLWSNTYFAGESTYRTTGSLSKSEDTARKEAVEDLARRIVEKTIEYW